MASFRSILGFLTPVLDKLGPIFEKDTWPSWPRVVYAMCLGLTGACVALRAFFDGSAQRHSDRRNGNGTGFITKT